MKKTGRVLWRTLKGLLGASVFYAGVVNLFGLTDQKDPNVFSGVFGLAVGGWLLSSALRKKSETTQST